tara:strand:+ start:4132 stop:4914 length:783 start_codon:yes stop_codon:yes gene_type:complete
MEFVNTSVQKKISNLNKQFNLRTPYRYLVIEDFLNEAIAEEVYNCYPKVDIESNSWDGTTYLDQKNKFTKTKFEEGTILFNLFEELNSPDFLDLISQITNINSLIGDSELFGGGLHQSTKGAFLNVHVDYNFHPKTKFHRRCNLIIYLNKNWKDEYNGHLELWDFTNSKKGKLIEKIAPSFNRAVIFETNEISYHGHPLPLNTPKELNRKSIATYYYTKERKESEIALDHNTLYKNTRGIKGLKDKIKSGIKASIERLKK